MAKHITITGQASKVIAELFSKTKDIEIEATFNSLESLSENLLNNGVSFLHGITSITVLDYGFTSGDYDDRLKEFLYLQDALRINNVEKQNVRLYVITKDVDFYREVKKNPEQYFIYLHSEVFLIENKYKNVIMSEIIRGGRHKKGLYNPDLDNVNLESRLNEQADNYIKETKAFNNNIIKVEKEDFLSEFAREEYMDSQVAQKIAYEEANNRKREEKLKSKKKAKETLKVNEKIQDVESEKIEIVIKPRDKTPLFQEEDYGEEVEIKSPNRFNRPQTKHFEETDSIPSQNTHKIEEKDFPEIEKIKQKFDSLAFKKGEAVRGKLETDKGVLAITSFGKSGASSILANVADIFAVSGKNVLVIDLDVTKKTQTSVYFSNYLTQAKNHYGFDDGLIKCLEGGSVERNAVEISSRVSVLGLPFDYKISSNEFIELLDSFELVLDEARTNYDIILIDIPENLSTEVLNIISSEIDKNIFVIDNKYYTYKQFVEGYLPNLAESLQNTSVTLLTNSDIILNKYSRENLDLDGKECSSIILNKMLHNVGYPYDRINIAGELPYYADWDKQLSNNLRYVWTDYKVMGIYRYVFSKVVW